MSKNKRFYHLILLLKFLITYCGYSHSLEEHFCNTTLKRFNRQISGETCTPPIIKNGKITVHVSNYTPGTQIPNFASISFQCDDSYGLSPETELNTCRNGRWYHKMPQCIRTCPIMTSHTVDLTCTLDGLPQNCSQPMVKGTLMSMSCKKHYAQLVNSPYTIAVCRDGYWDQSLLTCVPECGQRIGKITTLVVQGDPAKHGDFPWHIGIYRKSAKDSVPMYNCGGSLISVNAVVTAAHCFTSDNDGTLLNLSEFKLAAGKYFSAYNSQLDVSVQKRDIKSVQVPNTYKGTLSNFAADIAVVIASEPFTLTDLVQPVCIDWDSNFEDKHLVHNNNGQVAGWGYTSPNVQNPSYELKTLSLPYIERGLCIASIPDLFIKFVTFDKFCAGHLNGSSVCNGDSGGGLVFATNEYWKTKYYLRGVISVGPTKDGECDNEQYGVYTKISSYLPFIKTVEVLNRHAHFQVTSTASTTELEGNCAPLNISNGNFIVSGSNDETLQSIPNQAIVSFRCDKNYRLFPSNAISFCQDGKWQNPEPKCLRTCISPQSDSIDFKCTLIDEYQDCTNDLIEGTIISMECKEDYVKIDENSQSNAICKDGSWDSPFIHCIPECNQSITTDVQWGIEYVKRAVIPWHVGIYRKTQYDTKYEYVCAGSVVQPNIILSSAHCVTNVYGELRNLSTYSILAGDYIQDYDSEINKNAQIRNVKNIIYSDFYETISSNYTEDIAIIILDKPFILNTVVQPLCIDWNSKIDHTVGTGRVYGWGSNPNASELIQIPVSYLDVKKCANLISNNSRKFITADKFCTGHSNGLSICNRDNGGALVYKNIKNNKTKYYIKGIINNAPGKEGLCNNVQYNVHTDMFFYLKLQKNFILKNYF